MAGIIDGEGYFSILYHKSKNRYMAVIGVMNTSTTLMEWLTENFGGKINYRPNPKAKPHWKPRYSWTIYSKAIDALLPKILPFLVIKKQQALLILQLRQSFHDTLKQGKWSKSCPVITPETIAYREEIRTRLAALNHRNLAP